MMDIKILAGIMLIALFGMGHCLLIALAGSSAAAVQKLLEDNIWRGTGT